MMSKQGKVKLVLLFSVLALVILSSCIGPREEAVSIQGNAALRHTVGVLDISVYDLTVTLAGKIAQVEVFAGQESLARVNVNNQRTVRLETLVTSADLGELTVIARNAAGRQLITAQVALQPTTRTNAILSRADDPMEGFYIYQNDRWEFYPLALLQDMTPTALYILVDQDKPSYFRLDGMYFDWQDYRNGGFGDPPTEWNEYDDDEFLDGDTEVYDMDEEARYDIHGNRLPEYDEPSVVLKKPAEGERGIPVNPTFEWTGKPGKEQEDAGITTRGDTIDRYEIEIKLGETEVYSKNDILSEQLGDEDEEFMFELVDTLKTLDWGKTYTWRVRARQGGEWGPWSAPRDFDTANEITVALTQTGADGRQLVPLASYSRGEVKYPVIFVIPQRGENAWTALNFIHGLTESLNPTVDAVQYNIRKEGSQTRKRWPNQFDSYDIREGEHEFGINDLGAGFAPNLEPGKYWFWATAEGDNTIKSDEQPFWILEVLDKAVLDAYCIDICEGETEIEDGHKVCAKLTDGKEVRYRVNINFLENFEYGSWFSVIKETFQAKGTVEEDFSFEATRTGEDFEETYKVTGYSTEVKYEEDCTKYATYTIVATVTTWEWDWIRNEATRTTLGATKVAEATHHFILDLLPPTVAATFTGNDKNEDEVSLAQAASTYASITTATVTFYATDTKCLGAWDNEKVFFDFEVTKGIGDWKLEDWIRFREIRTDKATFKLGEGSDWNNEITVKATWTPYTTKTVDVGHRVDAQFEFIFKDLDKATVTATMYAFDCCYDDDCSNCIISTDEVKPFNVLNTYDHKAATRVHFLVDNVFFTEMQVGTGTPVAPQFGPPILEFEGFNVDPNKNNELVLVSASAASPTNAGTITVRFADANWNPGHYPTEQLNSSRSLWSVAGIQVDPAATDTFSDAPTITSSATKAEVLFPCSGWATKTELILRLTIATPTSTTGGAIQLHTFAASAVDNAGNHYEVPITFWTDDRPASLTYFHPFRNPVQGDNVSRIQFQFDELINLAAGFQGAILDGGVVIQTFDDPELVNANDRTYLKDLQILLGTDRPYTFVATATDYAGNTGTSQLTATPTNAPPR